MALRPTYRTFKRGSVRLEQQRLQLHASQARGDQAEAEEGGRFGDDYRLNRPLHHSIAAHTIAKTQLKKPGRKVSNVRRCRRECIGAEWATGLFQDHGQTCWT